MIVVDTNVVSELLRSRPDAAVLAWLAATPDADLVTVTPVVAELLSGVAILPPGARRVALAAAVDRLLATFDGRVWAFDEPAAVEYAAIIAERRSAGRPIAVIDALIAAIARSRGAAVSTRDVTGMSCPGLVVIDPWLD